MRGQAKVKTRSLKPECCGTRQARESAKGENDNAEDTEADTGGHSPAQAGRLAEYGEMSGLLARGEDAVCP